MESSSARRPSAAQGRGGRQPDSDGDQSRRHAGRDRGGCAGHARGPRRDPAVSWRRRALWLEGGQQVQGVRASTNTAFAPTLRGMVPTDLPPEVRCAYEIVIDGLTLEAVERATAAGISTGSRSGKGIVAITAGNYGGKLGPFHIRLHNVLARFGSNTGIEPAGDEGRG